MSPRTQGLLNRLFGSQNSLIYESFKNDDSEKIAKLFEEALHAHYTKQPFSLSERLKNLSLNADAKELAASAIIQALCYMDTTKDEDITEVTHLLVEGGKATVKAIQNASVTTPPLVLYRSILVKSTPLTLHYLSKMIEQLHAYFNLETIAQFSKMKSINSFGSVSTLTASLRDPNYYETTVRKEQERFYLELGLMPQEIEPLLQTNKTFFESLLQKDRELTDNLIALNELVLTGLDLNYLELEFQDVLHNILDPITEVLSQMGKDIEVTDLIKRTVNSNSAAHKQLLAIKSESAFRKEFISLYSNNYLFRMIDISASMKLFFHDEAIKSTFIKYDTKKDDLTGADLTLLMYVSIPFVNDFIRSHRAEFDSLCESRGLKKSFVIQDIIAKNPQAVLEDILPLAKIPVPVLMNSQSRNFSGQSNHNNNATVTDLEDELKKLKFK